MVQAKEDSPGVIECRLAVSRRAIKTTATLPLVWNSIHCSPCHAALAITFVEAPGGRRAQVAIAKNDTLPRGQADNPGC